MTQSGLTVSNLSALTPGQQALHYIQMCIGNPIAISFVVILVRRYYFYQHYEDYIKHEADRLHSGDDGLQYHEQAMLASQRPQIAISHDRSRQGWSTKHNQGSKRRMIDKLELNMIHRTTDQPKPVNPVGEYISDGVDNLAYEDNTEYLGEYIGSSKSALAPVSSTTQTPSASQSYRARRLSDPGAPPPFTSRPESLTVPLHRSETTHASGIRQESHMIHWLVPPAENRESGQGSHSDGMPPNNTQNRKGMLSVGSSQQRDGLVAPQDPPGPAPPYQVESRLRGFGGFPLPHEIVSRFLDRFFPKFRRRLHRTLTVPRTITMVSQPPNNEHHPQRYAPYFSTNTIVGRNSMFHLTSSQQAEEIGGIEYRALNMLLWMIPLYHIGLQLLVFTITAPYMSMSKWASAFVPPAQVQAVPIPWFSIFQTTSAITNTGMSLVDLSFLPFQTAYPVIFFAAFLILAGNTAFPVFFRFMIWSISKIIPNKSRLYETLQFLLDHPRRCYIYLFPSQQTYFLLAVVTILTLTDWFCFMVLDIGNDPIEAIPVGTRLIAGLFQSIAARTAGFAIVPLAALSPAVQVTYVIMMYISAYPIALSVRSTNVYEEHSLGIYPDDRKGLDLDEQDSDQSRIKIWGRYLAIHVQKQLAFDMWWLGVALWLVCIVERGQILDDSKKWFNVFSIVFELVSAYGTVGLSLGMPTDNFSLSGSFRTLSKLVVCAVMIRGRHRGLPVAIDRAVLLPSQLEQQDAASSIFRGQNQADGTVIPVTRTLSLNSPALPEPQTAGDVSVIDKVDDADSKSSQIR